MSNQGINSSAWNTLRNKAKDKWRANGLPCGICGAEIDWNVSGRNAWGASVDHIESRMFGGETIVPLDQLRVVHNKCNSSRGSRERHAKNKVVTGTRGKKSSSTFFSTQNNTPNALILSGHPRKKAKDFEPDAGISPDDQTILNSPWIKSWIDKYGTEAWPRLSSAIHPEAVDSLGVQAIEWINERRANDKYVPKKEKALRPWQELVILRSLECDKDQKLVWRKIVISSRRQAGKSVVARELILWRTHQKERFGEEQLVLHTAQNLAVAREIQRPARAWADEKDYRVRLTHGNEEIELPDGSRWMIRGTESVYGYSVSMGFIDEAWGVKPEVVDDGLEPTMIERESSQLYLFSTAHESATDLMLKNRSEALKQMFEPASTLILEWSAHKDSDNSDIGAWQQASPHWDEKIKDFIAARVESDGFRSQWLNIWAKVDDNAKNYLVSTDAWKDLHQDDLVIPDGAECVVAVDDYFGMGGSIGIAWMDENKVIYTTGQVFERMADVWAMAKEITSTRPMSHILAGVTIVADPNALEMPVPVHGAGTKESRSSIALVRELVNEKQLRYQSFDLDEQIIEMVVKPAPAGGLVPAVIEHRRTDLVKVCSWAIQAVYRKTENAPMIY